MKHPYEVFGMVMAVIIVVSALSFGIAVEIDDNIHDYMETNHSGSEPTPEPKWNIKDGLPFWEKNKENIDTQLDCKTSKDLQEFYDCVNKP